MGQTKISAYKPMYSDMYSEKVKKNVVNVQKETSGIYEL
jgi:hypothetical protein